MTEPPLHDPGDDPVPGDWPAPTAAQQARRRELIALIRREIADLGGAIAFARFMELALYAPGLGYYSAPQPKFGEHGDFVTAPELSPLFGRCLARQIAQALEQASDGDVLEAGAGSGALAAQLLPALEQAGRLPRQYSILELSADLRSLQRQTLERAAPHLLGRVQWLDALPLPGFRGVVVGNELLDAMPVSRFRTSGSHVVEQYVSWNGSRLHLQERSAGDAVRARVEPLSLAPDYSSEIGFHAEAWVRSIAERLERGLLLLIDYGFPRAEFYHPQRSRGTLMCHYRHRAHGDPLMLIGLQDITAHIDFTAMAEAASGLDVLGFTSQAAFLLGCGLAEMATETVDDITIGARLLRSQAINKLTAPQEMGELFKVLALGRGIGGPLLGFALQDRRARL